MHTRACTQVICEPGTAGAELCRVAARLRPEYVVSVKGTVRPRKDPNARLATGAVELAASEVRLHRAWGVVQYTVRSAGACARGK